MLSRTVTLGPWRKGRRSELCSPCRRFILASLPTFTFKCVTNQIPPSTSDADRADDYLQPVNNFKSKSIALRNILCHLFHLYFFMLNKEINYRVVILPTALQSNNKVTASNHREIHFLIVSDNMVKQHWYNEAFAVSAHVSHTLWGSASPYLLKFTDFRATDMYSDSSKTIRQWWKWILSSLNF